MQVFTRLSVKFFTILQFFLFLFLIAAEDKREESETQASELLIKKQSLDELLGELGSKGPRSVAKTREQVDTIYN